LERAEQEGIAALALFAPQQFNVEIGIALPLRWLSRGGIETGLTLSAILEPLEDRTIGIDGGGLGEFARFSHAGPGEGHADCSLWGHAFIVSEGLERRKAGSIAYEGFERDGDWPTAARVVRRQRAVNGDAERDGDRATKAIRENQ
jgi:phage terminase large subunit-like protein